MTSEKSIFRLPHKLEFNSLFLWIATASFFSFALVHLFLSQANLDASWLLHAAWRITNGERLYIDIFESNPPLAVYFNLPAVFLARLLDISEITTFYIFLFSLIVLSLILTWKFLGLIYNKNNKLIRNAIFIVILFVTLILVFGNYGQREHLAFIFTLPYVYLVCARSLGIAVSRPLAIFIGLLAGIGMAFKPFFLLVWLFLECYLTFIARRGASYKRIENLPILTFNVLYAGLTLWSFPEYMAMLSLIRKYYFAYNNSVIEILINGNTFSLWIMAAVAMILFELEPQDNQVTRILFLTASAYLITALLQRKGWLNHMYPSQAFLYILLFTILLRTVEISSDLQRHIRGGLTSLVMILTAGLMLYTSY